MKESGAGCNILVVTLVERKTKFLSGEVVEEAESGEPNHRCINKIRRDTKDDSQAR